MKRVVLEPLPVKDHCEGCCRDLMPEERERGLCRWCYLDYLASREDDDAYDRERDEE